jgi:Predicted pyridoxal phosphate-dependent enzyme apparently involved in regulation of cell wall biogenesis
MDLKMKGMVSMAANQKLAIEGGEPVRKTPMPPFYPGSSVYDNKESSGTDAVIASKSPFRYYGPECLGKTKQFETVFKEKIGTKYALAVTSGTAAVIVALEAAGIGAGDKVIVPACTFIAAAGAVVCAGGVPVFADIDDSLNIDPDDIERHIDKDTKALIIVPIQGNPCQYDKIMAVAKKHHLIVIEDSAQSCGCTYHGRHAGTFGNINTFSLQMNKIITTGEGGVVVTDDAKLYERAVRYHDQGMFREHEGFLNANADADIFVGQNYRMSEITGAVALEQLLKLDDILSSMRKIKRQIKQGVSGIPGIGMRRINDEEGDAGNALVFLLENREKALKFNHAMGAENISLNYLYNGEPVYMQPQIFYQKSADRSGFPFNQFDPPVVYTKDMCPNAVDIMARNAVLSISPTWTEQDAEDVITAVKKVAAQVL